MTHNTGIIVRESYLKNILEKMDDALSLQCSDYLEIVGEPGMGKTIILNQIHPVLKINGITPEIHQYQGIKSFNILDIFRNKYANNSLLESYKGNAKSILYKSLVNLKSPDSDILIIIIDDAHLVPPNILDELRAVFNKIPGSRLFLILCGRPGFESENAISINEFDQTEFLDFFSETFGEDWVINRDGILNWFKSATDMHPYRLALLTELCIDKGLISHTFTASLELFKNIKFPTELVKAIQQRFVYSELSGDEKEIIAILAHSVSGQSQKGIKKILNKPCQKMIDQLVQKKWIIQNDRNVYELLHPILNEWVKSITKEIYLEIIHKITQSGVQLSLSEKAHYLSQKDEWIQEEIEILLDYSSELETTGFHFSAIQILEKLDPSQTDPKVQIQIAVDYLKINKLDKSKAILESLLDIPNVDYSWKIFSNLGHISTLQSDFPAAEKYYLEGLNLKNLPENGRAQLIYQITMTFAYQGKYDRMHKSLEDSKFLAQKKPEYDLLYKSNVASVHVGVPIDIKEKPFFKSSMKLAKKLNDPTKEAHFVNCYLSWKIRDGDYREMDKFGNLLLEYGKELFNPTLQIRANYLMGIGHYNGEKYPIAIPFFENTISMMDHYDIHHNRDATLLVLGKSYDALGLNSKGNNIAKQLDEMLAQNQIYDAQTKLHILKRALRKNPRKTLLESLQSLYQEFLDSGNVLDAATTEMVLAEFMVKYNLNEAIALFKKGLHYYQNIEVDGYLMDKYFYFCRALAIHGYWDEIELFYHEMGEIENNDKTLFQTIIGIMIETHKDHSKSVMALLWTLEDVFKGDRLSDYYLLYQWLTENFNGKQKDVQRIQFIANCLEVISFNEQEKCPKENPFDKTGFTGILFEWARSICIGDGFNEHILKDKDRAWLTDCLEIWEIPFREEKQKQTNDVEYPIVIHLLGNIELFIRGEKLTSQDWISRKTLEVLTYIILKGFKHKSEVLISDLFEDVWQPDPENQDKANKYKNVTLSRLMKLFKPLHPGFIIKTEDKIGINWESKMCKLDIDHFERAYKRSMALSESENRKDALTHYEIANALYRGPVAGTIGSQWIEPYRATFFQMAEDVKDGLKKCSEC